MDGRNAPEIIGGHLLYSYEYAVATFDRGDESDQVERVQ
jgi:hypothetical protein